MRILLIEKTEDDIESLRYQLGIAFPKMQCDCFSDPLLAIKAYLESPPDLTIFCKDMRIIDGFTFTRTLRKRYSGFTGVMLADDEEGRADAQKCFLEYIVRPADADELKRAWERICLMAGAAE